MTITEKSSAGTGMTEEARFLDMDKPPTGGNMEKRYGSRLRV
jgi:hypothetical protein